MKTKQGLINWKVSAQDAKLIGRIVKRASKLKGIELDTLAMDLTATHANGCPLKLAELLNADQFNFAHDVCGIIRHMNRNTGQLEGFFVPRFAAQ